MMNNIANVPFTHYLIRYSSLNMSIWTFLGLGLAFMASKATSYQVTYKPPKNLAMGSIGTVDFKITLNHEEEESWKAGHKVRLAFNLTNTRSWALTLLNRTIDFSLEDMQWNREKVLMIQADVIGVDALNVTSEIVDSESKSVEESPLKEESIPLQAILADRTLNTLFTVIMLVMIIVNTVNVSSIITCYGNLMIDRNLLLSLEIL